MTLFKASRIGQKIAWLVAISVLVSILTIASLLVWFQVNESIASRKSGLQATGYVYAAAIAESVVKGDKAAALSVLSSIARVPAILLAVALDGQNKTLATMGKATILQKDLIVEDQGAVAMLTKGTLPVAVDIVRGGKRVGRLVLIADIRPIRAQLLWTLLATALAAGVASTLGAAIAIPLQRRITTPILSVISAMRHIKTERDYKTKIDHKSDDETGVLVDAFNSMISEINFRDTSLQKLAYFDPLTGLPSRQYFQKQIDDTLAKSEGKDITAALILLDLDDFKQINDSFGHTVGDGLLMSVAAILKQETTSDVKLARIGGDEFVVIVENISSENEAHASIAPFIAALYQPVKILEHEIYVSTSVGVAMIPRDGKSRGELMRRADLALYSAKRRGQGFIHFYQPSMDEVLKENTEIALCLRRAITNNEFETHYQPQLNLHTGKVYGFECLLRWKHPVLGNVPPSKFVPIAESSGLIIEIGKWILRDSCVQACAWLAEGYPPREVSVNVSAAQILRADFVHDVSIILQDTGLPPHLLCLELTESLFIDKSVMKVRQMLDDLRELGVLLALDDFGTGYSSLSYLEKLPFDKLKVDRSFVSGCENDNAKRKILNGIIMLSHSLGMEVVAEGAETQGELSLIRDLGADHVQGYALSRPVPANKALAAAQAITEQLPVAFGLVIANAHPPGGRSVQKTQSS
jgi:diguanylate cyclase (GGDEF)-like protein